MSRTSCLYINDQRFINALNFTIIANFQEWLNNRLVKIYFEFFEKSTEHFKIDTKNKKKMKLKLIERLIINEKNENKQRYSRDNIENVNMTKWF
jgi:hypothetical protein